MNALLLPFEKVGPEHSALIGGKAYVLGLLVQAGFPVPSGSVLLREPETSEEWAEINAWWSAFGHPALAVRSSAADEDSASQSFAGQQKTFLNVTDPASLREAVRNCYASIHRESSLAYRRHFDPQSEGGVARMNVILQAMVLPRYSGVFFTQDPRVLGAHGREWCLEVIDGLGEDLVSGHRTPMRIRPGLQMEGRLVSGWSGADSEKVLKECLRARELLKAEIDVEWSIDGEGHLWLLQARPITTLESQRQKEDAIERELKRLKASHPQDTLWDGQTFAEWTGALTPLSFAIWRRAFSKAGALGKALHGLGYIGDHSQTLTPHESVLDDVFGKAYLNLSRMDELSLGITPYVTEPKPQPHLQFHWNRVNAQAILSAPSAVLRTLRVGWNLGSKRRELIRRCTHELDRAASDLRFHAQPGLYSAYETQALGEKLEELCQKFSDRLLQPSLELMFATEATQQSLRKVLVRIHGKENADRVLSEWIGKGVRTLAFEMEGRFLAAARDPKLRPAFLAEFGHRGPGEMDLSKPRWLELGFSAFSGPDAATQSLLRTDFVSPAPEQTTRNKVLGEIARQEWDYLKSLLELRELWKDQLLKAYAQIRWAALELGARLGWDDRIFWLRPVEIHRLIELQGGMGSLQTRQLEQLALRRKKRLAELSGVSLPVVLEHRELRKIAEVTLGVDEEAADVEQGEGLSSGIAYGEVRLVKDPSEVDWSRWPENAVLVAEATDPGWTPLFLKSRAIITERGGALSHCAIVARELGLPAVSGIPGCLKKFKEGDSIWVDGGSGRVTRA